MKRKTIKAKKAKNIEMKLAPDFNIDKIPVFDPVDTDTQFFDINDILGRWTVYYDSMNVNTSTLVFEELEVTGESDDLRNIFNLKGRLVVVSPTGYNVRASMKTADFMSNLNTWPFNMIRLHIFYRHLDDRGLVYRDGPTETYDLYIMKGGTKMIGIGGTKLHDIGFVNDGTMGAIILEKQE